VARAAPAREEYLELFRRLPFQAIADTPTVRYYTDWGEYEARLDSRDAEEPDPAPGFLEGLLGGAHVRLDVDVAISGLPGGVEAEAVSDYDDVRGGLKPFTLVKVANKMTAYHAYRWRQGVRITVESGVDFGRLVVFSGSGVDGYAGHHILLEIGEGARGEIVMVDFAGGSGGLKTLVAEARVNPSAQVTLVTLVYHSREKPVYSLRAVEALDGASVESLLLAAGGRMTRFQDDNLINGRKARFEMKASNIARPATKSDVILSTLHRGPESEGRVRARGVVIGDGYLAQRGAAILYEEATLAASEVESYVTLLSERGKGYAVPVLEIHTGEIARAGHSAAVASLGEDLAFYLKTRGLSEEEITQLIIEGVAGFSGVAEKLGIPLKEILK